MTRESLRDFTIALSIANLTFLRVWHALLSPTLLTPVYSRRDYLAAVLNVLLLTSWLCILRVAGRLSKQSRFSRLCRMIPLFILILPLSYIHYFIPGLTQEKLVLLLGKTGFISLALCLPALALYAAVRWRRALLAIAETILLGLVTFVGVTFPSAVWWAIWEPQRMQVSEPPVSRLVPLKAPAARVVWLIFDEMDQRLTFSERPSTLQLPEIDRFRSEALYASNAYPPAGDTLRSIPGLLTGRLVSKSAFVKGTELRITFDGAEESVNLDSQPSLLSRAHAAGVGSAVVGWYFPYCRIWGNTLEGCSWQPTTAPMRSRNVDLAGNMLNQVQNLLPWALRKEHMAKYMFILQEAKKGASDPRLGLTLVHWPTPHHPPIYDRHKGQLTLFLSRNLTDWYLHNLALVDRTLGELRRAMEVAGTWENTTILLTSDHPWRSSTVFDGKTDLRIPFLLKLSGQKHGITYDRPFNSVLTHDLLLALLRGELSSPESVVGWIGRHPPSGESPYSSPDSGN